MPCNRVAFLLLGFTIAGCGTEPIACTQSIEPAIVAEIVDSVTGLPAAEGARGAVRDGSYIDSLRPFTWNSDGVLTGVKAADERPGTYAVEVEHSGYLLWTRGDVEVVAGACHVQTVTLLVRLQPSQ